MNVMHDHSVLVRRIRELSRPMTPVPAGRAVHLEPLDQIETVLFDLYGTLLISGSGEVGTAGATDSAEALTQSLIVAGYDGDPERAGEVGSELIGQEIRSRHETARAEGTAFPEVEITRVWKKVIEKLQSLDLLKPDDLPGKILRLAVEYECRANPVWPMPGSAETIAFFKARGLRLGIVSNAQFYTPLILEALFGKTHVEMGFDPALCVWSYKAMRAKPSIELFQELDTDLSRAVYVGNDMLNDIWTASQAGCRTVLFAGDRRSLRLREEDSRCRDVRPDAIADELLQITEMI